MALSHSHEKRYEKSRTVVQFWLCECDCGNTSTVAAYHMKRNTVKSCGCLRDETVRNMRASKLANHPRKGKSETREYKLWASAKERAKKYGRDFNIDLEDIVIPEVCPVLGIRLSHGTGLMHAGSPQLDRRDNTKGYVKGNVFVISQRANAIKQNASVDMLEAVLNYMKGVNE